MNNFEIIPPNLAVKAMRDNGYKNTAYAIAELIDNAIQAKATVVELIIGEREEYIFQRKRTRVYQIAVLDNGIGMESDVLQIALQFGNGLYLNSKEATSIGRFGMGLPNSSISQARRVEVWTWEDGVDSAVYSYLDVDKIEDGSLREVPVPVSKKVPEIWLKVGEQTSKSGTLVVWSLLDRLMWKTGKTIIDNCEFIIGRTYRRFLAGNEVKIQFKTFNLDTGEITCKKSALPNDPLYLMANTSCPHPYSNTPMFEEFGEPMEYVIRFNDEEHKVKIRYSIAKTETRNDFVVAGSKPHGKHAAKNVGVSIIRADRELDLDSSWSNPSEPRDRWWGVEIDFPPALDDLFGVTNNKQSARYFSDLAKVDLNSLLDDEQTLGEFKATLEADEDPRLPLIEISNHIRNNIIQMRKWLREKRSPGRKRYMEYEAEKVATQATEKRKQDGYFGESDAEEMSPPQQREADLLEELLTQGVVEENAEELAATTVDRDFKYIFTEASIDTPAFFNVTPKGGAIIVTLITDHPAYHKLIEVLEEDNDGLDESTLRERLATAREGLKLLLMAWARYEDEQPAGPRRETVKRARWEWGKVASQFMEED